MRHQPEGGTPFRTIRDHTESEGRKIQEQLKEKTRRIPREQGFSPEGQPQKVIFGGVQFNNVDFSKPLVS